MKQTKDVTGKLPNTAREALEALAYVHGWKR